MNNKKKKRLEEAGWIVTDDPLKDFLGYSSEEIKEIEKGK